MRAVRLSGVLLLLGLAACSTPPATPPPAPAPPAATPAAARPQPAAAPAAHAHPAQPAAAAAGQPAAPVAPVAFAAPPAAGTRARCPVMGETFTVDQDTLRSQHAGKHYAFCCPGCKGKFDAEPAKYSQQ
ncbi:MAG TPA: YHS domain-containing protein [Polyangia bacterium]|jgi:YHS domain-containing protein